jgi:creatinine amidohydrolase
MLAIAPDQVDLARAEIGNTQPIGSILPQIIAGGIAAVSPNGVLGDPSGSSVEAGNEILKLLVDDLVIAVKNWMR